MQNIKINTPCGKILGIDNDDYVEFRGIKYANAKRWEYPTPVTSWEGTYDATEYGECCFQRRAFEDDADCSAFYHREFRQGLEFEYSEDCQFLNIVAPKDAQNAPVIIYIHGGSFTGGSSNENHISGVNYAKNGVIFVAFNYRLGPYGFASHPDLTDDKGRCGNYGLYDQKTAILWIKNNISAFGGDPNKITIMGQSAGAMSVDILISAPELKNVFAGAIMMSGVAIQRSVGKPLKPEKTVNFWDKVVENANCLSMAELRNVDEKTLFYAWSDACKTEKMSILNTLPCVDGEVITPTSFNMGTIPDIPMVLGVTITDMAPVALEVLTRMFATKASKNTNPCYVYNFKRELPGDNAGAWHSCDLLYAFSTLDKNWRPFEKIDYDLQNQMSKMIIAFAKTSNPNCNALPKWESGCKKILCFGEETKVAVWNTPKFLINTFNNQGAEF